MQARKSKKIKYQKLKIKIPKSNLSYDVRKKSILYSRISHTNDDHIKTSLLIDQKHLPNKIIHANLDKLNQIPHHRPIVKIKKFSGIHSPISVQTPKGSILKRVAKIGPLSFFSNEKNLKPLLKVFPITKIPKSSPFFDSYAFNKVTSPKKNTKTRNLKITLKKLHRRRKQDIKNNFKRSKTQNAIMRIGATEYAQSTSLFPKQLRFEWLHLVGHFIAGKSSQKESNLVAGTAYANTEMMLAEASLFYFAKQFPEGFYLNVSAELIPNTHIATSIIYTIKTPDFEIPFTFNTQTINQPHRNYQKYFNFLAEELTHCKKNKAQTKRLRHSSHPILFYNNENKKKELHQTIKMQLRSKIR